MSEPTNPQERRHHAQTEEKLRLEDFAGGLAHRLGNIIHPITWSASLIQEELSEEDHSIRREVDRIEKAAHSAKEILEDLATLAERSAHDHEVLALSSVINKCLKSASMIALAKAHQDTLLECRIESDGHILGSREALERILLKLTANAYEASSKPGAIRLSLSMMSLAKPWDGFETIPAGDYHCLEIEDNGEGVLVDPIERIFDPFTSTKSKGRGLSLAVVYRLVKSMQGYIDLKTGSQGTIFLIYYPTRNAQ